MVKTHIAKTKQIYPFGGSSTFFDRQDEMAAERALPTSVIVNSEAYKALQSSNTKLQSQVEELTAKLARYEQAKPPRRKSASNKSKSPTRGRQAAAPILKTRDDGVSWYSYAHLAKLKGLNVSNVWRQVDKKGLNRQRFEDGVWRIPAAQAERIERRAYSVH